ncbi:MAG: hypothetical protein IPG89_19210 [Bacteroidetes bacterium]|nr:hypothetical protein [Bacteroidota bacterium]
MSIPLSKRVIAILEKRSGEFPRQISDQRYNEYIKEVCKLGWFNKKNKRLNPKNREQSYSQGKWYF